MPRLGAPRACLGWSAALLVVVAALAAAPAAGEEILRFDAEIRILPDGRFEVTEDIAYHFRGLRRHGIYRDIPVRYERRWGEQYPLDIEVLGVTDDSGRERPHRVLRQGRDLRIRIGSPDRTVTDAQHYRLRYRVEGGLLFLERTDELYWNATGHAWSVPIRAARVRVALPADVEPLGTLCFTGPVGSREQACEIRRDGADVVFEVTRELGTGAGLTVAVELAKGQIAEPGFFARTWRRLRSWGGAWLLAPFAALAAMLALWRTQGRDPEAGAALVVRYEPPGDLTPAEVGALLDERVDLDDVTATVLDLAVRGHLRIHERPGEGFLFLSDRDYELERLALPDPTSLRPHEARMLEALFRDGPRVELASLKNRFHNDLAHIVDDIEQGLTGPERHFVRSPRSVRRLWRIVAAVIAIAALYGGVQGLLRPGAALAVGAAAAIVALFAPAMPRKTRRGRRVHEQILGFREFLNRVERDRLERDGRRDTATFERILPYAQVLGVADPWADAFADLYSGPPAWYVGARGGDFVPRRFVADVGRALETLGRTVASRPSSGGGGSGFGGGGFSGGGFGGGGGGSW